MTAVYAATGDSAIVLRGGSVFDGSTSLGTRDVLVRGHRIVAVEPAIAVGDDVTVVDCEGHTVVPGLIDAHVHLAWAGREPPPVDVAASRARALRNADLLQHAGVTTVRDTGGPLEVLGPIGDELARGSVAGPELVHCGRILCAQGGHGTEISVPVTIARECTGPNAFRLAVHEQLTGGARFIKVALNGADGRVQLTRDELTAVVDEAHQSGVRVAAHASVRAAVALAVECGVDSVEHGNGLDNDLAQVMAANDVALVPTVAIFTELQEQFDRSEDHLLTPKQLAEHRVAVRQRVHDHITALAAAGNAGVTIGLGTDRVPGGSVVAVVDEGRALLRHGLSAIDVLRAATANNAHILGLDDRGAIRPGARGDVAVFRGPLADDLELLQHPSAVVRALPLPHQQG